MRLTRTELFLCVKIFKGLTPKGVEDIFASFHPERIEEDEEWGDHVKQHLIAEGMLEKGEEKFIFSPYAQRIMDILVRPDVWLSFNNSGVDYRRLIYVKGIDYLYMDIGDEVILDLLPTLPYAVGAYALVLEKGKGENNENIHVFGQSYSHELSIDTCGDEMMSILRDGDKADEPFKEEDCVNQITEWILTNLKEING